LEVAEEASRAVLEALQTPRKKTERPPRVKLPQLVGCAPLDQTLVPPLPRDRPLRVLEIFAPRWGRQRRRWCG
jgi:hypothetical protein